MGVLIRTDAVNSFTDRVNILGIEIDNLSMDGALQRICGIVDEGPFSYIVTPNVDHLIKLKKDASFRRIYDGARLVLPDGVPLVWAARILGTPLRGRVNGTDLCVRLSSLASAKGYSIFLLGGSEGVAKRASEVLEKSLPALRIAGYYYPEFGFDKNPEECLKIQKIIASSGADILFVGLGAPKQEKWIQEFGAGCKVKVAIGVGVSFSFISGDIRRSPLWMQRNGMEWLWRLLSEPRRLFRRYIIQDMPFVLLIAKAWLEKRRA
jgi:N-acetylglucosaminyldiphosphoundecaprenol N-acetyl-beta-D-mannosaminyltransferase